MQERIKLTKEGYEKLKLELEHLIKVDRAKNLEDLKAAREQGDLSENADYDAARNRQSEIENRINEINVIFDNYEIVENSGNVVAIASTVKLLDLSDKTEDVFKIASTVEVNITENIISDVCPLGAALIGHKVGDVVKVTKVKHPYEVKILEIK